MANSITFVSDSEARFVGCLPGVKVRVGGVEVTADGEAATRTYSGGENLPALETFASKILGAPQVCKLLAPGIYSVLPRPVETATAAEILTETPVSKKGK
jgi:hypothetical protein